MKYESIKRKLDLAISISRKNDELYDRGLDEEDYFYLIYEILDEIFNISFLSFYDNEKVLESNRHPRVKESVVRLNSWWFIGDALTEFWAEHIHRPDIAPMIEHTVKRCEDAMVDFYHACHVNGVDIPSLSTFRKFTKPHYVKEIVL